MKIKLTQKQKAMWLLQFTLRRLHKIYLSEEDMREEYDYLYHLGGD